MHLFDRHNSTKQRAYVSDFTRFMDEFMAAHPEERRTQREGWFIFWDKRVDLKAQREHEESEVPTPAYYYFELSDTHH